MIDTERLRLRRLELEDAPFVVELLNEPSFLRFIGDKKVRTLEDAKRYLREGPLASYERHGYGLYLVAAREDEEPLGICGLVRRPALAGPDLGYAFLPRARGRGFAREAATASLEHGRHELGLERIFAVVVAENERSVHLLDQLGFAHQGQIQLEGDGNVCELYVWPATR